MCKLRGQRKGLASFFIYTAVLINDCENQFHQFNLCSKTSLR